MTSIWNGENSLSSLLTQSCRSKEESLINMKSRKNKSKSRSHCKEWKPIWLGQWPQEWETMFRSPWMRKAGTCPKTKVKDSLKMFSQILTLHLYSFALDSSMFRETEVTPRRRKLPRRLTLFWSNRSTCVMPSQSIAMIATLMQTLSKKLFTVLNWMFC